MDLEEFILETLGQIVAGVSKAQDQYADLRGPQINPNLHQGGSRGMAATTLTDQYGAEIERVEFDVAVTVSESKESGGGAGIRVFSVGANLEHTRTTDTSSVSRVKFSVPIAFKVKRLGTGG